MKESSKESVGFLLPTPLGGTGHLLARVGMLSFTVVSPEKWKAKLATPIEHGECASLVLTSQPKEIRLEMVSHEHVSGSCPVKEL